MKSYFSIFSIIILSYSTWMCTVSSFTLSHTQRWMQTIPNKEKQIQHIISQIQSTCTSSTSFSLYMSNTQQESEGNSKSSSNLPFLLDPGTKGGALFLSIVLFIIPLIGYQIATGSMGIDEVEAGKWIGVGFTVVTLLLWAASYIFRVATKDMTYAKQLKDYENAVIAKRLEELDSDEVQALLEDIERDEFK